MDIGEVDWFFVDIVGVLDSCDVEIVFEFYFKGVDCDVVVDSVGV